MGQASGITTGKSTGTAAEQNARRVTPEADPRSSQMMITFGAGPHPFGMLASSGDGKAAHVAASCGHGGWQLRQSQLGPRARQERTTHCMGGLHRHHRRLSHNHA